MADEQRGQGPTQRSKGRSSGGPGRPATLTPLWIISLFLSLAETVVGIAAMQTQDRVQWALVIFAISFPLLVAAAFFAILWSRPWALYHPGEYGKTDVAQFVEALSGASTTFVRSTVDVQEDVKKFGNPDQFKLLFKVQAATWKKSTKAMEVPDGCLVQVTTEQLGRDNCWRASEALSFVPNVVIMNDDQAETGRHLAAPHKRS